MTKSERITTREEAVQCWLCDRCGARNSPGMQWCWDCRAGFHAEVRVQLWEPFADLYDETLSWEDVSVQEINRGLAESELMFGS